MLPKKRRVTKELFQKIMKIGGTLSSPFFVLRYIQEDKPQYAFVAPKSMAKRAVDRNTFRRTGYRALSSYQLNNGTGIFFYKKAGKEASFTEIKDDIGILLKKAHFIKE